MAPRLKVEGPLGHGFKTILRKRLKKAQAHLDGAEADLEAAVHDARKEFKACRSLARLLRHLVPAADYRTLNASLRDAGHAIGALRDAHALGDAIDLLAAESGISSDAKRPLRRAAARAAATRKGADEANRQAALAEAQNLVGPLTGLVKHLDLPDDDPSPYLKGLARSYREARAALRHGFETRVAEDLHEARKRVINWRYQLDVVSPIWPPVIRAEVAELQALREHLGQHNDIVMLQRQLETEDTPWSRLSSREEWIARAAALRPRLAERAEFSARLLFAEKPKRRAKRLAQAWQAVRRQGE